MSPQTASLYVLEEHPRIFFAPRDNCKKKVNQLHSVISNRDINLTALRLLLLSVVRPSLEYGSEIWDCNKSQARALESIILGTFWICTSQAPLHTIPR